MNNIKTISDFLSYCHMPVYYKSDIRNMRNGDLFIFGQYKVSDSNIAEVWIEKIKKTLYSFHGTWTILSKSSRPLKITFGKFNLYKAGIIEFDAKQAEIKNFALICRYIEYFLKNLSKKELSLYTFRGVRPLLNGTWLDKNAISRRRRFDNKTQKLTYHNFENYLPTHQLQAIVSVGIKSGAVSLE